MRCPNCSEPLSMSERQGIEIDYCPSCRGVWLDRGELDKIIEKSAAEAAPGRGAPPGTAAPRPEWGHQPRQSYPHQRRKNFFEELFD